MFFGEENNLKTLGAFIRKAEASHIEDEVISKRLNISKEIIGFIHKSPEGWDERCTFNIKHIGDQYLQWLRDFDSTQPSQINHIFVMTYRFLCEFDFLIGEGRELNLDLRGIISKIQNDTYELEDDVRSQMHYASYIMPANIAKEFINDSNIGVFRDFETKKTEAEELKKKWNDEIQVKTTETEELKNNLDKYKTAFNFVGLYQVFQTWVKRKIRKQIGYFGL